MELLLLSLKQIRPCCPETNPHLVPLSLPPSRYVAAVELLGERDEALEELRADLQDVKNLYRCGAGLAVQVRGAAWARGGWAVAAS